MILKRAKKMELDGIAIVDHNEIKGAFEVKWLNKDPDFKVIIGEAIKTPQGDLLAYNLNGKIEPCDIHSAIDKIKEQGGMAEFVVLKPFQYGGFMFSIVFVSDLSE